MKKMHIYSHIGKLFSSLREQRRKKYISNVNRRVLRIYLFEKI
jgi:hypothetical protein